jgi:hypothetical protein
MAEPDKKPVTLEELLVSSLAQTDALAKLLIEKGLITREEFMQKISEERADMSETIQAQRRQWCIGNISARDSRRHRDWGIQPVHWRMCAVARNLAQCSVMVAGKQNDFSLAVIATGTWTRFSTPPIEAQVLFSGTS